MTRENRLKLGKKWHEVYKNGGTVKDIPEDHPYIQEWLNSEEYKKEQEAFEKKPSPKGVNSKKKSPKKKKEVKE